MELDILKNTDPVEVWAPFGEDEVLIRHITREELQGLSRKATKTVYINHAAKENIDQALADRLLGRAVVRDWKGFTMEGKPFPYSLDNCDLLMNKWTAFSRFINDMCSDLDFFITQQKEQKRKNSLSTSGPGSTTQV